jgi:hypothetical protein
MERMILFQPEARGVSSPGPNPGVDLFYGIIQAYVFAGRFGNEKAIQIF